MLRLGRENFGCESQERLRSARDQAWLSGTVLLGVHPADAVVSPCGGSQALHGWLFWWA